MYEHQVHKKYSNKYKKYEARIIWQWFIKVMGFMWEAFKKIYSIFLQHKK
jgi:hypothetical protein